MMLQLLEEKIKILRGRGHIILFLASMTDILIVHKCSLFGNKILKIFCHQSSVVSACKTNIGFLKYTLISPAYIDWKNVCHVIMCDASNDSVF